MQKTRMSFCASIHSSRRRWVIAITSGWVKQICMRQYGRGPIGLPSWMAKYSGCSSRYRSRGIR